MFLYLYQNIKKKPEQVQQRRSPQQRRAARRRLLRDPPRLHLWTPRKLKLLPSLLVPLNLFLQKQLKAQRRKVNNVLLSKVQMATDRNNFPLKYIFFSYRNGEHHGRFINNRNKHGRNHYYL